MIRLSFVCLGLATALCAAACSDDGGGAPIDAPVTPDADVDAGTDAPPATVVAARPSKSGTIAITEDDTRVIMVNPEAGTVSIFDTATNARLVELPTGREPSAVVIHPDGKSAYVANRGDGTVVKIANLDGTPSVSGPLAVGSEPTGLALSPTGATLYVAEWAEGRIAVVATATMTETGAITAPRNPRGVAVTNDGDADDSDELIVVPEFYGEPTGAEAADGSRAGRVRLYRASDLSPDTAITLAAIDSGFAPSTAPAGAPTVTTAPNQLWNAVIVGTKLYLPSISAAPAAPTNFQSNVHAVVYVGDLATHAEDRGLNGTMVLPKLVRDQIPDPTAKQFLADIVDLDFIGTGVAYVLSRGSDTVQRVVLDPAQGPRLGSPQNKQIELNTTPAGSAGPCQTPTGIVTAHAGARAFVNCWVTRSLGVLDLSQQALTTTVASSAIAAGERDVQDGRRFFFTGRGRWSNSGWSDCASCHPDGLSDNITWSFAAGPRQSTSLDGSYTHGPGAQQQRAFNWTGIFDEMHDFERNTRGVSGGKGAVTRPDPAIAGAACGNLAQEAQAPISADGLGRSVKLDQDVAGNCTHDWDKVEAYGKTVRPPLALRKQDPAAVARGAALFGLATATANNAGCVKCHGGPGWTASRVAFPLSTVDPSPLVATPFTPPAAWAPATSDQGWNFHTTKINTQPSSAFFPGFEATNRAAPNQIACVLRNVGTFGGDALEQRLVNGNLVRAQGRLGYNVPSLYGLAVGAPYLHHGGGSDLADLFDDPAWQAHITAGNPVWLATGTPAELAVKKADLAAFLLSIDAVTPEQALPAGFDGCL
ncbi:MAG: YncE family protein [Kofleriaceae bacterium]|nr:YncE family protein [Kofleriaceae bacterium]